MKFKLLFCSFNYVQFLYKITSPEVEFLLVTDSLTNEAQGKHYKADNIHGGDVIITKGEQNMNEWMNESNESK